jgi:glyoxylase-like metal-dependent hydrolase (beta-lactamase superfamily II)
MRLSAVAEELWTVEHPMRFPGGVRLPSRMTIVRLPSHDLLLHSPVPIDDELAAELDTLGPVAHVIAPSLVHHIFVGKALARYPHALLTAAPGLAEKCPELPVADVLTDEPPEAWQGVIDQVVIAGAPRLNEVVFLHRPSRTLIATDLVFNVRQPASWSTGLVLRVMGTHKRFAQSRLWHLYTKDRDAVRRSLEKLMAWDFDRVLPGHGDPFEGGAREMKAALWSLAPTAAASP